VTSPRMSWPHVEGRQIGDGRRQAADGSPLLTIIIPAYNEAATIDAVIRRVLAVDCSKQVIVVDDGSVDAMRERVQPFADRGVVELLVHGRNQGKGAAIRTGLAAARGLITLIQDADLEYNPAEYGILLGPIQQGEACVVFGSRRLGHRLTVSDLLNPCFHGVTLLNWTVRVLYGAHITDEATCYKVFPTSLLRAMELECRGFEFCPEVTAKACRLGIAIREIPIHYQPRTRQQGKKIITRDAWRAMRCLWKYRHWTGTWVPATPMPTNESVERHQHGHE
jgi:dolichol-phosphate mannosyltransferase